MARLISACGLICNECDAFLATVLNDSEWQKRVAEQTKEQFGVDITPEQTRCTGCMTKTEPKISFCGECEVRSCCISRGFDNCSQCPDFSCEKTEKFYAVAPQAKKTLEELREK